MGRVYGAHFAWSHLWWVGAYPLAGWLGTLETVHTFVLGAAIATLLLIVVHVSMGRSIDPGPAPNSAGPSR
jgi:MFS transporter, NRE family, putaive nickel resistance protein